MSDDPPALRPPLKWAGGKRWLVPHLRKWWELHKTRRLVEPFCGGLAVALGLRPDSALLGDVNPHTINFYQHVQRGFEITGVSLRNERSAYDAHRQEFNRLVTGSGTHTKKAASLFYYLNRTCFNGLCRFNRSGEFNVPFGRHNKINYLRDFSAYSEALKGWEFVCSDFSTLPIERGDFVYADPPYDQVFSQYAAGGFGWNQQVELADQLAAHEGPVVASNQATDRIIAVYQERGFSVQTLPGPRYISRNGDRTPALEMLATRGLD